LNQNFVDYVGLLPLNGEADDAPLKPLTTEELYPPRSAGADLTGRSGSSGPSSYDFAAYLPAGRPHFVRIACMWLFLLLSIITFATTGCIKCALFVAIIPLMIAGDLVGRNYPVDRVNGYAFLVLTAFVLSRLFVQ
jgi:hypothetical protein